MEQQAVEQQVKEKLGKDKRIFKNDENSLKEGVYFIIVKKDTLSNEFNSPEIVNINIENHEVKVFLRSQEEINKLIENKKINVIEENKIQSFQKLNSYQALKDKMINPETPGGGTPYKKSTNSFQKIKEIYDEYQQMDRKQKKAGKENTLNKMEKHLKNISDKVRDKELYRESMKLLKKVGGKSYVYVNV
jgi:hypothetical protein